MDLAITPAIERIARVLAGQHFSRNADGNETHAAATVDARWREFRNDAVALLKTLREPDSEMERTGDIAVWSRMIAAALGESSDQNATLGEVPEPGTDPLHEGP